MGKGELPGLDAALNIAEGYGGRNREAWAPVLLEMAQVPVIGSDALTLSVTLDKIWAAPSLVRAAGVAGCPSRSSASSGIEAENLSDFPGRFRSS